MRAENVTPQMARGDKLSLRCCSSTCYQEEGKDEGKEARMQKSKFGQLMTAGSKMVTGDCEMTSFCC